LAPVLLIGNPLQRFTHDLGASARGPWRSRWSGWGLQGQRHLRHCSRSRSAVLPMPGWVADRWPSLRALLGLAPPRSAVALTCEGLPALARHGVGSTWGMALVAFTLLQDTTWFTRSGRVSDPARSSKAANGSGNHRTPLLRFSKDRPSVGVSIERPLLAKVRRFRAPKDPPASGAAPTPRGVPAFVAFGPEMPPSGLVTPLSFLPTSACFSARYLAGLLRPAANRGVRRVSNRSPAAATCPEGQHEADRRPELSSRRLYPSKLSPRRKRYRVTAAAAFPPLRRSPCRRHPPRTESAQQHPRSSPDLKALFPRRIRCFADAFPPRRRPMLPWASNPCEDRPSGLGAPPPRREGSQK